MASKTLPQCPSCSPQGEAFRYSSDGGCTLYKALSTTILRNTATVADAAKTEAATASKKAKGTAQQVQQLRQELRTTQRALRQLTRDVTTQKRKERENEGADDGEPATKPTPTATKRFRVRAGAGSLPAVVARQGGGGCMQPCFDPHGKIRLLRPPSVCLLTPLSRCRPPSRRALRRPWLRRRRRAAPAPCSPPCAATRATFPASCAATPCCSPPAPSWRALHPCPRLRWQRQRAMRQGRGRATLRCASRPEQAVLGCWAGSRRQAAAKCCPT